MDGISRLCSVAYQIIKKLIENIDRINAIESGTQEIDCNFAFVPAALHMT